MASLQGTYLGTPVKKTTRKPRPLTLYPLKPEEALAVFMRADPKKVAEKMQRLRRKRGS